VARLQGRLRVYDAAGIPGWKLMRLLSFDKYGASSIGMPHLKTL
jgi:hypothetical protein